MANINKIRLSGTTYNIEDENASKTVELTQAQYDALEVKEPNTYYVITDATAVDIANYYTKTETDTALATKQATLVSGTNIKTINNESILGEGNIEIQGGGATYTAGTNISIDTANTINCTLPFTVNGSSIMTNGNSRSAGGNSFICGYGNVTKNDYEFNCGVYGTSMLNPYVSSAQTLFLVGNGTSNSARHNAFEIRRNGDIYVNDGTNNVRLQDTILALGGLKLVKLTQSEYDQLATKDPDTLYIISNVVS